MSGYRALAATTAALILSVSLVSSGASAGAAQKTAAANAPELHSRLRGTDGKFHKASATSDKRSVARVAPVNPEADKLRAQSFANRASVQSTSTKASSKGSARRDPREHPPTRIQAADKVAGDATDDGRGGTGLGDIFEDEPNDATAQTLDDLPVNVVGAIEREDDIDYYRITARQGDEIRIEIVADRIFGTLLDSYVVVFAETGDDPIVTDDDYYDGSGDSFIQFTAPDPGNRFYYIGVTDFGSFGGENYDYVINITMADSPDTLEQEPNDTTGFADVIPVPHLAFGLSDVNADTDVIRFNGLSGDTLVVDVDAELFLSDMDPVVELFDDGGGYLFGVDDTDGLDPRFNLVLPYSGAFYLAIYDANDRGGDTYYYSINVSIQDGTESPVITGFKIQSGNLLKRVLGSKIVSSGGGTRAEINSVQVPSKPAPRNPTKAVKLTPFVPIGRGDVVTLVNPDGRRSNPGVIN